MYPLHDKDLDRLSRDAAEHYEVDYGPSGWEQLEKRLDQELPQRSGRRRFLFWLFFIVVTTGGALTGLLINSQPVMPLAANVRAIAPAPQAPAAMNNPTKAKTKTNNTIAGNNTAGHSIDQPVTQAGTQPASATPKADNTPLNNKQATVAGASTPAAPAGALPDGHTHNPVKISGHNKTLAIPDKHSNNTLDAPIFTQPFGLNRQQGRNNHIVKKPTAVNDKNDRPRTARHQDLAVIPGQQGIDQDMANDPAPVAAAQQTPVTTPHAGAPDNQAMTGTNPPAAADSAARPAPVVKSQKDKKDQQRGFEISVIGGPDGTTIQSGPMSKSGYNVGLQIGYRLSDRWSINTGVIYTKKFYKTDSSQYKPKGDWYNNINVLGDVKGYCSMLDIPLNIRYDASFNDKRRLFVSTGLSTYIMDKQNYAFRYNYRSNPTQEGTWDRDIPKNETYLFSVLNLSVGYERHISRTLSLQVEPYLKLPLKEMGYGYLRMNSYGMFFALKYKPSFRSKPSLNKR